MDSFNVNQVQIGDYVDIIFNNNKSERYYIVKVKSKEIIIARDVTQNHSHTMRIGKLTNDTDSWQIIGNNIPHTITFVKNSIDTQYFARDFTQAPIAVKKLDKTEDRNRSRIQSFIELKNGIILHQLKTSSEYLGFTAPNNANTHFFEIFVGGSKSTCYENYDIFYFNDGDSLNNPNDEIFIFLNSSKKIVKLNLNLKDLTFTKIDKNPLITAVYQLKHKKLLCLLEGGDMYILDLVSNKRTDINSKLTGFDFTPKDHLLSNGDIILECWVLNSPSGQFYRINIDTATITKIIPSSNFWLQIIAILPTDKTSSVNKSLLIDEILVYNKTLEEIEIWQLNADQTINKVWTNTSKLSKTSDRSPINNHIACSEVLRNGDVLFNINEEFYLFDYHERTFVKTGIYNLKNYYRTAFIQELRNGNLIVNSGSLLTIMEFPLSQREMDRKNYDEISSKIILISDIKNLIRNYLWKI